MKAYVHEGNHYVLTERPVRRCGSHEVRVRLHAASLNRRDLYIKDRRQGASTALILGSDGAGTIEEVGPSVTRWQVGDEVIINPSLRWYTQSEAAPADYDILGMPDDGTFAETITISEEQVEPALSHLTWEENASLALAGMTGYRALVTKGQVTEEDTVFIPGGSSGVATYMIQIAKALGARVVTSSRDAEKREQLKTLGADLVLDTAEDWGTALKNETITLVIDSVGRATFNRSLEVLERGGRLVVFGATTEDTVELDLRTFFYNQQRIIGSTMACREELQQFLDLMKQYELKPVLDCVYPLQEASAAMERLEQSEQFGKVVLTMN